VKRTAEEERQIQEQIMQDETAVAELMQQERASYRALEEAEAAAIRAQEAAADARRRAKTLQLDRLKLREKQVEKAKLQLAVDAAATRKQQLERYLASPLGFLDEQVATAKVQFDRKKTALADQATAFRQSLSQPNAGCSAKVGAGAKILPLATTIVGDSARFDWLLLRRTLLPATTELEKLVKMINLKWKRSPTGAWVDDKIEKVTAPVRGALGALTENLNVKVVQPASKVYTSVRPRVQDAKLAGAIVAETVAADVAPKMAEVYGATAPKVQSFYQRTIEKCLGQKPTTSETDHDALASGVVDRAISDAIREVGLEARLQELEA